MVTAEAVRAPSVEEPITRAERHRRDRIVTPPAPKPKLYHRLPGGTLQYRFHPGQAEAWRANARFVVMMSGTQGGKTTFGPPWLHREMERAMAVLPEGEMLGDFLAITTNYDLFMLAMLPQLRVYFEDILRIAKYHEGIRCFEFTVGLIPGGEFLAKTSTDQMYARIILRSAEALSGLEALTAKAAWLDELGQKEWTVGAWEAILRRLAIASDITCEDGYNLGRILGTTTLYTLGWLKTQVYDKWAAGDEDFAIIQFDSTQNPTFSRKEFERARKSMPDWKFQMQYRGRFDQPHGLVYKNFDESVCIRKRFTIPKSYLWYTGHDFGSANPASLLYAQNPKTGTFYMVHEYFPGPTKTSEQIGWLKSKTTDLGYHVVRSAGGSHQEEDSRETYTIQGWPIAEPMASGVSKGIQNVFSLHASNAIVVFDDCLQYISEKQSYAYDLDDQYNQLESITNASRFHGMDCERYIMGEIMIDVPRLGQGPNQVKEGHW